jgi:hypothetical protein
VHDFGTIEAIDMEHVLSMSARVAGELDLVSASIRRRTRTLSIVGHGLSGDWNEARLRSSSLKSQPSRAKRCLGES